jgi:uncharacterized protein
MQNFKKSMLRASSYNIYIPLPESQTEMLLVHGYTGAYDKVSNDVAAYVKKLDDYHRPKPLFGKWSDEQLGKFEVPVSQTESLSDEAVNILVKRGYLTYLSHQEEEDLLSKLAGTLHENSKKPSYIIMPTYNCNLRCSYCFQDYMRTDKSFAHLLKSMSIEMADRIINVMGQIETSKGWKESVPPTRHIGFFGGEPLLKKNRQVVEHFITELKKQGEVSFYAVTNGTDLHYYQDLLKPDSINYLQITLDGPLAEHDKRRIYPNGKGSFNVIADNISMALEREVRVSVRMNIDRNNVDRLPELAEEFRKRGWNQSSFFGAYAAPIHASNDKTDKETTFDSYELDVEIDKLREAFPGSMSIISKPDDSLTEHVRSIFHKKNGPSLKSTFCGAHNEMYIFDAFGDIYACWEVTGDKKVRIGHIAESGDISIAEELYKMWRRRNVTTNPICKQCKYALHCGGGCAVLADRQNGTVFSNFCDAFGKRFNTAVAAAYVDYVKGEVFKEKQSSLCST